MDPNIIARDLAFWVSAQTGEVVPCQRCARDFVIPSMCFYGLCDHCFNIFDNQKMRRRFGVIGLSESQGTEDVVEWIKEAPFKPDEPNEANQMTAFYGALEAAVQRKSKP